jgi:transposase-like protein
MKKYDDEFKQNAVKKVLDGQSVASVARELGVTEGVPHKWKRARLTTASDAEREVIELRKKLREVEMERDILNGSLRESSAGEVRTLPVH